MKICVLGLEAITLDTILADERLANLRRLMELGVYGRLKGALSGMPVASWTSMATSRDARLHTSSSSTDPNSMEELTIWDYLARLGKKSLLIGLPGHENSRGEGSEVSCLPVPLAASELLAAEGEAGKDLKAGLTHEWQTVRGLLGERDWDYFHFVESDKTSKAGAVSGGQGKELILDYRLCLDEQIGLLLEMLDDDTILLILASIGARLLDGLPAAGEGAVQGATNGAFILTSPNLPPSGEREGVVLLDIVPTLLNLAGYPIPASMQGRPLFTGSERKEPSSGLDDDEKLIQDRLSGLGYI